MKASDKLIFIFTALFLLVVDQSTKAFVRTKLSVGKNIPVLGRIFSIEYIQNPGALFGMFPSYANFFIVISVLVIIISTYVLFKFPFSKFLLFALGLMLGGIAGNLIDRTVFGYVTDFLYITHWPIFNVADSAIDIGLAFFVYYVLKYGKYL
jgi:signal peptidase II